MKDKIIDFCQDVLMPKLDAFSSNHIVKAIQSGMMAPLSAMIIGSVLSILKTPPVAPGATEGFMFAWQQWAADNASWLNIAYAFSMDFIAVYALIGLIVALSSFKKVKPTNLVILALMSFLILCCNVVPTDAGSAIAAKFLGSPGLFSAIIVSIVVFYLARFLTDKGIKIKLPSTVPPNVAEPIESLFVSMIIVGLSIGVRLGLAAFGLSLPTLINLVFQPLLSTSDTLPAVIIYILVVRGLWFFGIHGGNVAGAIMTPILTANLAENIAAYAAGEPLPYIFTQTFAAMLNVGQIPLVIAMFMVCRSSQLKAIRKIALLPAVFCIGEPTQFGVPTVFNFKLLIPYLGGFLITGIGFYLAMDWGWMGRTMLSVPFTLPGPVKAFLATMDWRAAVIWIVLIAVCVLLYIPFLKSYDNDLVKQEEEAKSAQ